MKGFLNILSRDPYVRNSLLGSFVLFLAALVFYGISFQMFPAQVPVFYSRPWGQEQLAPPLFLILPAGVAFLFLIANLLIIHKALSSTFLRNTLYFGSALALVLAAVTIARVILLIT